MSSESGTATCDRCGADVGNGSLINAVVVSDLNLETGLVVNFHFCRDRYSDAGELTKGCDSILLGKDTLKNYLGDKEMYKQPALNAPVQQDPTPETSIES